MRFKKSLLFSFSLKKSKEDSVRRVLRFGLPVEEIDCLPVIKYIFKIIPAQCDQFLRNLQIVLY